MVLKFEIEGIDELQATLSAHADYLGQDMAHCALEAGDAAIQAMQENHPYQDRTYNLSGGMHCRLGRQTRRSAEAVIEFTAYYARYVNDGTSRSRAYPFVPIGVAAAEATLARCVDDRVAAFCASLQKALGG